MTSTKAVQNEADNSADQAKVKKISVPQLVRGMHDILPADWPWWSFVISEVADLAQTYSFARLETPVLEKTTLFTRAIGATTDVVEKKCIHLSISQVIIYL